MNAAVQELIRAWVQDELARRGWDQARLAKESSASEPSISLFLTKKRGVGQKVLAKIESVLGLCPVEGGSALRKPNTGHSAGDSIHSYAAGSLWFPVVDIRRLPTGLTPDALAQRITAMAEYKLPASIQDPAGFWLRTVESPIPGYPPGALALISPGTPTLPGDLALWETERGHALGQAIAHAGNGLAMVLAGQLREARLIGRVAGVYVAF